MTQPDHVTCASVLSSSRLLLQRGQEVERTTRPDPLAHLGRLLLRRKMVCAVLLELVEGHAQGCFDCAVLIGRHRHAVVTVRRHARDRRGLSVEDGAGGGLVSRIDPSTGHPSHRPVQILLRTAPATCQRHSDIITMVCRRRMRVGPVSVVRVAIV